MFSDIHGEKKLIWTWKYYLQRPSVPAQFLLPQCLLAGFPLCSPFPRSANSMTDCTVPKLKPLSLPTPSLPLQPPESSLCLCIPAALISALDVDLHYCTGSPAGLPKSSLLTQVHSFPCLQRPLLLSKPFSCLKVFTFLPTNVASLVPPPRTAFSLSTKPSHFQHTQMPSLHEAFRSVPRWLITPCYKLPWCFFLHVSSCTFNAILHLFTYLFLPHH